MISLGSFREETRRLQVCRVFKRALGEAPASFPRSCKSSAAGPGTSQQTPQPAAADAVVPPSPTRTKPGGLPISDLGFCLAPLLLRGILPDGNPCRRSDASLCVEVGLQHSTAPLPRLVLALAPPKYTKCLTRNAPAEGGARRTRQSPPMRVEGPPFLSPPVCPWLPSHHPIMHRSGGDLTPGPPECSPSQDTPGWELLWAPVQPPGALPTARARDPPTLQAGDHAQPGGWGCVPVCQ